MRPRTHALVLVVGAAAALLVSAPALGAAWLSPELTALSGAGTIQQSPAIAVDPAAPLLAAVVADDGTSGAQFPTTATAAATDWSVAWAGPGSLSHSGSTGAGQADVAWGIDAGSDRNVYAVDVGSSGGSLCNVNAGVFLWASANGGVTYPDSLPVSAPSNLSQAVEPAIAVARSGPVPGRVYVAFTRIDYPTGGCSTASTGSRILLTYADPGGTFQSPRPVSPFGSGTHYRSPSLAALPDGRVVLAFRNDTPSGSQTEAQVCDLSIGVSGHYCGAASASPVGPTAVLGDATAPGVVSGVGGATTPRVVAAGGRVTVAWHANAGGAVRAFAAMSTDSGASFGPAQQIDAAGAGNQVAPRLAATAQGRDDAAYLWDPSGTGIVRATTASAGPPLAGATTEAWAQPVVVQAAGATPSSALPNQAGLGRGLGVATADVPMLAPLPATVVAFTDTQNPPGDQNVRVAGVLHGTTAPAIAPQIVKASKNTTTIVTVAGSDDDGDPLTWSVGAGPTNAASKVSIADAARGDFAFKAANDKGTDTFEAVATDGVPGHEVRRLISVNVVNDPPEINCTALVAREDTPYDVPIADCVSDPNGDPLSITLDNAKGGTVERVAGTWRFIPKPQSTAPGSFVLHASDGEFEPAQLITVTIVANVGTVRLEVEGAGKRRTIARGMALRFAGTAITAQGIPLLLTWTFDDGTPDVRGSKVAHRFRREGSYTVKAQVRGKSASIKVVVRRRAVELIGVPRVFDGVMTLRVRTRVAGKLSLRVDSRSRTVAVPSDSKQHTLSIQVTTGPLARLTLRLRPTKATVLPGLSLRRLVLVSPLSAG
jgi:hypothetical protein